MLNLMKSPPPPGQIFNIFGERNRYKNMISIIFLCLWNFSITPRILKNSKAPQEEFSIIWKCDPNDQKKVLGGKDKNNS